MTELHELTALELADAYRRGETDPVEAVDHFLGRIAAHGDEVGAFVTVTADAARAAARAATSRLRGGDEVPVMYGIPTAIKDLNATAGVPTTFGSAVFTGFVPPASDEVVGRIERAGMISLGKTNTPEFGCPCYTEPDPSIAPPARSPYDLTLSAGGSSGGAAAAVAARLLPIAQASDGGGSIRIPASVTGLVGFKPSRGRISRAPVYGDITGLSTAGPMATTVRDSAAMLDVMAGPGVGDPTWAPPLPAGETYLGWCDREPGRLRIARWAEPVLADEPVDPQVLAAYQRASTVLTDLGHEVVDVAPPIPAEVLPGFRKVWAVSAALTPVPAEAEHRLRPLTRWLRAAGRATSAPDFGAALIGLHQVAARAIVALAGFDAVLTPTLARLPAPVGALRNDEDPAADFAAQVHYTPFAALWNVTGMPAVSLPVGWSDRGWPIGVMLAGRPAHDHVLYALAAQVEAACSDPGRPWRRPPIVAQLA
jgi:amidase